MKLKKIVPFVFAVAVMLCCVLAFSLPVSAATSGTCGDNLTWTLDDAGTLTISGTGAMTNYASYKAIPWYSQRSSIKTIVFESGVTSIGDYAFYNCDSLTFVTIPDSVTSIGESAFSFCDGLTSITIPDSATSIGKYAFGACDSLTSVTIGNGVTNIGKCAFGFCGSLTSVTIPDSVTSIGESAFVSCTSLISVTIPNSVVGIYDCAFNVCTSLTSITFAGDAPSIGDNAFYDVEATAYYPAGNDTWTGSVMQNYGGTITWVAMGSTIASGTCGDNLTWTLDDAGTLTISGTGDMDDYGDYFVIMEPPETPWLAYAGQIKAVIIEEGVTSIGWHAFYNCTGLTSVSIANSVTRIGYEAFYNCDSLTSLTIPVGVVEIQESAIFICEKFANIYYEGSLQQWLRMDLAGFDWGYRFKALPVGVNLYIDDVQLTGDVVIPEGVTEIGVGTLKCIDSITSLYIPASVTSIGDGEFAYMDGLTGIWVDADNLYFSSDAQGVLFNKAKTKLLAGPKTIEEYTIPRGVTEIGSDAFYNAKLTSVFIADTVVDIDDFAFGCCKRLNSVVFPKSVQRIGRAFNGCSNLKTIKFLGDAPAMPDGCSDHYAFELVTATAYYPAGNATWENYMDLISKGWDDPGGNITWVAYEPERDDSDKLVYEIVDGEVIIVGSDPDSSLELVIPEVIEGYPVTSIEDNAFEGWTSLVSVTIPDTVTYIGNYAFHNCTFLTNIYIGTGVTHIGDYAFSGSGVVSVIIPDSVTEIGIYVFYNCTSLTNVVIGSGVTYIGDYTFCGCSGLTSIVIPETVTGLGDHAFSGSGLTDISIPNSVTYIGNYVFYNCTFLTNVYIGTGVTHIGDYAFSGSGVVSVIIPDSVTEIGIYVFYNCTSLTNVVIGSGVTYIGDYTFCGCSSLTGIVIPETVTGLGDYAFSGSGLTYISIPNSVTYIGNYVFYNCTFLTNIYIGTGVTHIGEYAFCGCEKMTVIRIQVYVTQIGCCAFNGCSGLRFVCYYGDEAQWREISIAEKNDPLLTAEMIYNAGAMIPGDLDGDSAVINTDVEYLLWYTLFPADYPLLNHADFNSDGNINNTDVEYLLWHTLFSENYPLTYALVPEKEEL